MVLLVKGDAVALADFAGVRAIVTGTSGRRCRRGSFGQPRKGRAVVATQAGTAIAIPTHQNNDRPTTMTLDATPAHAAPSVQSVQSAPEIAAVALSESPDDDGGEPAADDPVSSPFSRLSFCIAWLFGLEAFLREPSERDGWQAR